jgi:hypothetical protein
MRRAATATGWLRAPAFTYAKHMPTGPAAPRHPTTRATAVSLSLTTQPRSSQPPVRRKTAYPTLTLAALAERVPGKTRSCVVSPTLRPILREGGTAMSILWIVLIVILVLVVLGVLGRGRF